MTNKRKKLVRSVSKKTGMSYAGAVNHLRGGLRIIRKPFEWKDVFAEDGTLGKGENVDVRGFRRVGPMLPVYERPEGSTVYTIGEDGDCILAISKAKRVILPLVNYEGPGHNYAAKAIEERMFALIEVGVTHGGAPIQLVSNAEAYFRKCFKGEKGVVRVQKLQDDVLVGILEPAGIVTWATPLTTFTTSEGLEGSLCHAALGVWDNKVKFCKEAPV